MNSHIEYPTGNRLKGVRRIPLMAALLLSVISCASVEDFQAMSPEQRAEKVCAGTTSYRERKRALSEANDQIRERENLLATGYRLYEQCQLVSVSVAAPGGVMDCSGLTGSEAKKCKNNNTAQTTETRRVCVETRVPIDYNYESALLRDLRLGRESQMAFHEQLTEDCRYRASSLSAEEAFLLYDSNGEP